MVEELKGPPQQREGAKGEEKGLAVAPSPHLWSQANYSPLVKSRPLTFFIFLVNFLKNCGKMHIT